MTQKFSDTDGKVKDIKTEVDRMNTLLFAVVVIMLLMIGNMLIDSWNNKSGELENFSNQINQQNIQIQQLSNKIDIQTELEKRFNDLKTKNPYLKID